METVRYGIYSSRIDYVSVKVHYSLLVDFCKYHFVYLCKYHFVYLHSKLFKVVETILGNDWKKVQF